jgi:hypothetical protein
MRYFALTRHPVGKFLRQYPQGIWIEPLGDTGSTVDERLKLLGSVTGYTPDDLERHIVEAIRSRARETLTVGEACIAVRLDPRDRDGHVQFTHYAAENDARTPTFQTGWVLTPRLISSPGTESTFGCSISDSGQFAVGGFSEGETSLHVRTRIPASVVHHGGPQVMAYGTQARKLIQ